MFSSQNYPGAKGLLRITITGAAFGFYPKKEECLDHILLERNRRRRREWMFNPVKATSAQLMPRELEKKATAHFVWQGSQKAVGVLCHIHLGFSGWVRLTKTLVDPTSNHILLTMPV